MERTLEKLKNNEPSSAVTSVKMNCLQNIDLSFTNEILILCKEEYVLENYRIELVSSDLSN